MQTKILVAIAATAALVAACDRSAPKAGPQPSPSGGASQTQSSVTPSTAAKPTQDEKREGANPTQGQVDPKEPAQHRDFQNKDDAKGPSSEETAPKR